MGSSPSAVKRWRKNTKEKMVKSMGGKCQCCGYDKCNESLHFHHIDPNQKDFGFGKIIANPKKWEDIEKELKKCILVCSNCHGEIHAGIRELPEKYATYQKINCVDVKTYCPVCGKEKKSYNKTCSRECAAKLKGKISWEDWDLEDLIVNKKMSCGKIGDMIGCSDQAVRKRAKKLKIIP